MASISNRSNYVVTVEDNPELTKHFPFTALDRADRYAKDLPTSPHFSVAR